MVRKYDYLVIGSGIAGMSFALKVAGRARVAVVCKTTLDEANTYFAQGGVASVTDLLADNFDKHIHDTMVAGDWLSDPEAVEMVVRGAPAQIRELVGWGVDFDRKPDGSYDLHREGGHSEFRILHHADNTGAEIQESLVARVREHPDIDVFERHFAVEIITQHHLGRIVTRRTPDITCYGAYILDEETGKVETFLSRVTLMATGGVGAVYTTTTNPLIATGDGIAMVYRAKGTVKDMEFIQFHPTALYHPGDRPSFLITEAMRGYGAVLRNLDGSEFMHKYDPRLSLAPRDIVARAIDSEMKLNGTDHVYLDVTHKDAPAFPQHLREMPLARHRHHEGLHTGGSLRPLPLRRNRRGPQRRVEHQEAICRGRMQPHRSARRQPSGIQLSDRGRGICRRGGRPRGEGRQRLRAALRRA